MTTLIAVVIALQIVLLAAVGAWAYVAQRRLFFIDARTIAGRIAGDLLADYRDDMWMLTEQTTGNYARHKYMLMVTELGLPSAAVDTVAGLVWHVVRAARGETTPEAAAVKSGGNPFYE